MKGHSIMSEFGTLYSEEVNLQFSKGHLNPVLFDAMKEIF